MAATVCIVVSVLWQGRVASPDKVGQQSGLVNLQLDGHGCLE